MPRSGYAKPLPAMEFQADRSQAVYRADIKERGGWVTSPDDDGLVLMLGLAPVRTKDGKPVRSLGRKPPTLRRCPRRTKGAHPRALGGLTNWFIAPPTLKARKRSKGNEGQSRASPRV